MKTMCGLLAAVLLFTGMMFSYVDHRELTLSTEGIERFDIDCSEGYLVVVGDENTDRIEVKAEIYVKSRKPSYAEKFIEDFLLLSLQKKGNKALLVSHFDNDKLIRLIREKEINLKVKMPMRMDLYVDDDSGSLKISHIEGRLEVDDDSGNLTLFDIIGDVDIDDNSGDIEIDGIKGDVYIDDNSGDIYAENIMGEIEVDDNSGSIDILNSRGDVIISDDSGDIRVDNIEMDVIIKSDGSGDVLISNVRGKVYNDRDE